MATVTVQKLLHCPLCFKNFTTPRVLPCYHTFCEKCLGTHIESQVQGGTEFMCPLCAAPTVPTDSKLAVDKWAIAYPLNTLICSILELSGPKEKSNNCEPCETDGQTTNAEFWCKDCREKMCRLCKTLHKRNKQMIHHAIVFIDEMDQLQQSNVRFDQECCLHQDKIKFFCVDHRELCCAVCVSHRQCKGLRSVDDIVRDKSQRSKSDYSSIIRDMKKLKIELEKITTEKKINAKQILEEKEQMILDMDTRIDRIFERLNKARTLFRKETEQLYQKTESSILENEKMIQRFTTNVENTSEILEVMEKNGTPQQQFAAFENLHRQLSSHYCQLKLNFNDDNEVNLPMNKFLNDLEETLDSLVTIEISKKPSTAIRDILIDTDKIMKNLDSRTKVSTEMSAAQVEKKDLMTSPVTFVKSVTRQKLGSRIWFTGGIYTPDGRLVMADRINKRLVELDDEYNVVEEYKIDGKPTDVAAGNKDNEIYIAVNKEYIYKCVLHTNLTIVGRIKAPPSTCGIAVSGDNIIVGTNDAVVILTQDGSTVRSIPKSGGDSYVVVSQTQRTIYHRDNDDVVCRTWEGQEVFRYQHQQLTIPCGIEIDSDRNVFVCGWESHNVHQVSPDGQRSRIIQLHNISGPNNVVLHPQKQELVVTSCEEDTLCEVYRYG